jgi:signal transduction histidine kinase/ActR/RegA family two-component response regulator
MNPRKIPTLPAISAITLIYFVVGYFSLKLAFANPSASPVWPPAGIAIAALLIFGYRVWPAIFVGAFLFNAVTAGNLFTSFAIATGNTVEAVCAAWLLNRFAGGMRAFESAQNVFKFAAVSALSTALSPTIGVTTLALSGFAAWNNYATVWTTWWLGDLAGAVIVTPLVVWWLDGSGRKWTPREMIEVTSLFMLLIGLGFFVFSGWFPEAAKNYPVSFLRGPIVIWMAFRFTPREAATGLFILTGMAIWGTLHGFGPFVMDNQNQALVILDARTLVTAVTVLAIAAAISERNRAHAAVEQQKEVVEAANRTKDNFLAMLSHELRTPLTPVIAALDALETETSPSDLAKSSLSMIRRNVELESQLIDDLLDLTRIAKDKIQLRFGSIDAHEVIANVVDMCRAETQDRRLNLHVNLRAGAHHVLADAAKFQQIIWNLMKNAIKFTGDNGDITISTTNLEAQTLTISVQDTGIGIEPEIMIRIFDPFEQGERSFQRRYGGLGLGLAISKSLTQAHGGVLTAKSDGHDHGSTFVVTMKTVAPPARPPRLAEPTPATRPLRILLVDDHLDTCTALERLLVRRGHLVAAAHNVRSAMEAATRSSFDLLISDIALPDGTGTELMSYLHAISHIPGIAISGFGMNGDIEKSFEAGFAEHLVKPVKMENLEAAIDRVMAATPVKDNGG